MKPVFQKDIFDLYSSAGRDPQEVHRFFGSVLGWRPVINQDRAMNATEFGLSILRQFIASNWPWTNEWQRVSILELAREPIEFTRCCVACWEEDEVYGFNVACLDKRYVRVQLADGILDINTLERLENLPRPHTYSCIVDIAPLMIGAMKALEERRNAADAQKRDEPCIAA